MENKESPSSQRAWIEIFLAGTIVVLEVVALLAEGVDRNFVVPVSYHTTAGSPSSQRAWIEISLHSYDCAEVVSPSSQRAWIEIWIARWMEPRRPPSPSSQRAWIEIGQRPGRFYFPESPSSQRAWIEIESTRFLSTSKMRRPPRRGRG